MPEPTEAEEREAPGPLLPAGFGKVSRDSLQGALQARWDPAQRRAEASLLGPSGSEPERGRKRRGGSRGAEPGGLQGSGAGGQARARRGPGEPARQAALPVRPARRLVWWPDFVAPQKPLTSRVRRLGPSHPHPSGQERGGRPGLLVRGRRRAGLGLPAPGPRRPQEAGEVAGPGFPRRTPTWRIGSRRPRA